MKKLLIVCLVGLIAAGAITELRKVSEKNANPFFNQSDERVVELAKAIEKRWSLTGNDLQSAGGLVRTDEQKWARYALGSISVSSPQYAQAQKILASLIKSEEDGNASAKKAAANALANDSEGRKRFAKALEEANLKAGMNAYVSVSGPKNTRLIFKYILMNRVYAYQLDQTRFFQNAWNAGFNSVVLTDGNDFEVTYTVKK